MSRDVRAEIDQIVKSHKMVLFMKGTPEAPQCGFSSQIIQVLGVLGYPYHSVNVLEDLEMREMVKVYADWPTIPQLYLGGEFIGGCDITLKMYGNGELHKLLTKTFEGEAPQNQSGIKDISPEEATTILKNNPNAKILDVRTKEEWDIVHLDNATFIDQSVANQIIDQCPKNTPLICLCHVGTRSLAAANYFVHNGFSEVYNVRGGIDGWAKTVDKSLPTY